MSRIGKKPVPVPAGVEITLSGSAVTVKGKAGELSWTTPSAMKVSYDSGSREILVERPNDEGQSKALQGLTRAILNNMVRGVVQPFEKKLEVVGVGYNALLDGKVLQLQVGFANAVRLPIPANVQVQVPDQTHIVVKSCDRQAVGQFAAVVRQVRPPEPYKGKGIRYQEEHVRRKAGKAFGAGK